MLSAACSAIFWDVGLLTERWFKVRSAKATVVVRLTVMAVAVEMRAIMLQWKATQNPLQVVFNFLRLPRLTYLFNCFEGNSSY